MTISLDIQWRDYQKKTLKEILGSAPNAVHVIKSPRQSGKSTLLEALLMYYGLNCRGSVSICVSPTFKQCKKIYDEIKNAVEPLHVVSKASEATMTITFTNTSKILFLSGESNLAVAQGWTVKNGILAIDEAAYLPRDFVEGLLPTVDVHRCPVILASTPRFADPLQLFYQYWTNGIDGVPGITLHDWSGFTLLTEDKLEFYRRSLPDSTFRQYYLGEFTTVSEGVFGDYISCVSNEYDPVFFPTKREGWSSSYQPEYGMGCVAGIDWASGVGGDETVITIFNDKKQMVYIEGFSNKDETETIEHLAEILERYKPRVTKVESNSIGQVFYGLLKKRCTDLSITSFNTSQKSKQKLVNGLQVAIQNKEVQFLNDEKLISQLGNFVGSISANGNVSYAGAKGTHDDRVMSTLIAYSCFNTGNYAVL
jgi:hypothetical protein